ncbi:MAG: hypothetical protein SFW09_03900 [Hyphomicrobiaceae bacterium]|nr:hypothetical protein [Hyphomicrobiaceae bacterium]
MSMRKVTSREPGNVLGVLAERAIISGATALIDTDDASGHGPATENEASSSLLALGARPSLCPKVAAMLADLTPDELELAWGLDTIWSSDETDE